MIKETLYSVITSVPEVISTVGVDNVHYQSNDEDDNSYSVSSPMITFAEVATKYSKAKGWGMYQITVWSKSKTQADSISEAIFGSLDMRRREGYNFSWVSGRTPIYDHSERMHGTAQTVNITFRKF